MNFLDGAAEEGGVRVPGLGGLVLPADLRNRGPKVRIGVRPEHLQLTTGDALRVDLLEHLGGVSYVHLLTAEGKRLIAEARNMREGRPGARVGVEVEPGRAFFFDPETGLRLR